ncbi:MAG TPA: amino acid racemase [Edaphobacter sp.]|nr:amino acid racemase [Edaphobacter sp.]
MNKGRCLGLLGGLGVGATIHYYQRLARAHEEQGRTLDIVITHAETSRVFEYVEAGDRDGLAEYLLGFIRRLQAAGAEFAVIPAITPHYCMRELIAASPLPLFDIFDPLVEELKARAVRRVAVFGTRYVMESSLYGFAGDVAIIRPAADEMDCIHNTYLELLQKGVGTEEQHRSLTAIAHALQQRDGVDAIVLAGTDLSLLFNEANTSFPHLDCAALHLQRIIRGLL